jgi:hypothetical integral membrane protein (TIGR02206 family)
MGFFLDERYARDFELFGWVHILVLALGVASIFGLYYLRGYLKRPMVGKVFRYTVATLLVAAKVGYLVWSASLGRLHWDDVVPMGLCDMMNWITMIALFFDLDRVVKVVLPWAFTGATLSFIVVDMGHAYAFPHFRFFHYFGNHWLFLVGNLYYLFTGRFAYRYKDLLRSTAWLSAVAVVVLGIDFATGTNNMFLREWPVELDFVNHVLGFPLNTIALMAGIFVVFNIFYLLFVVGRFNLPDQPSDGDSPLDRLSPAGQAPVN